MDLLKSIREQDPLKQGLKPSKRASPFTGFSNSRARSIKTRIETVVIPCESEELAKIREQDPLKQGLKQWIWRPFSTWTSIRKQDPLKQGLKLLLLIPKPPFPLNSRAWSIKSLSEKCCDLCRCPTLIFIETSITANSIS